MPPCALVITFLSNYLTRNASLLQGGFVAMRAQILFGKRFWPLFAGLVTWSAGFCAGICGLSSESGPQSSKNATKNRNIN
ncbi:hypothetical protein LX82_02573 [Celeribacter halophilus]|uniref:Uncharacterized protein n=1 Tax=Celeribacter halophilus TaxID=576117 RepID=A0A1I3UVK8_9RHOB|nr:hypothetical protein LX82_02573 [Celeribacter halophilus]SFJ85881.1 hypothetical protein SAMN04488138_11279 [Celeribacter halophilus]